MPMTLRELLELPSLELQPLVTRDLDRTVRAVHATETPDPTPYLRGGEVILTDGGWSTTEAPLPYARRLSAANVVALGYGLFADQPLIPPALVDACEAVDLTLFTIPLEIPYLAISEAFIAHLLHEREAPLQATLSRHERLLRASLDEHALDELLSVIQRELGRPVALATSTDGLIATAPAPLPDEDLDAISHLVGPSSPPREPAWTAVPVVGRQAPAAKLLVRARSSELTLDERAAVDQTTLFVSIALSHLETLREAHRRSAAEVFDLLGDPGAQAHALTRLGTLGVDPDRPMIGIVCRTPDLQDGLRLLEGWLANRRLPGLAAIKGQELVALVQWPGDHGELSTVGPAVSDALGRTATVGVSGVAANAHDGDDAIAEARVACRYARLQRDGRQHATHAETASLRFLLTLHDEDVLAPFRDALIGPLVRYDGARRTHLVETLSTFLHTACQWQQTAELLHIHVNTLRARIERVEQLTGRSLASMEDRVALYLALHSHETAADE